MNAASIRAAIALIVGILLIWAGIKGNLGSMLAAFIDPAALSFAGGGAGASFPPATNSTSGSSGA